MGVCEGSENFSGGAYGCTVNAVVSDGGSAGAGGVFVPPTNAPIPDPVEAGVVEVPDAGGGCGSGTGDAPLEGGKDGGGADGALFVGFAGEVAAPGEADEEGGTSTFDGAACARPAKSPTKSARRRTCKRIPSPYTEAPLGDFTPS